MNLIITSLFLSFYLHGLDLNNNKPKYIPLDKCPSTAKLLILNMNINSKKIHSCNVRSEAALNQTDKIKVVELYYGPPSDCLAGCIYKNYASIIEGDGLKGQFVQVPMRSSIVLDPKVFPQYEELSSLKDFHCQINDLQKIVMALYVKKENTWGLYMELQEPYICTWVKTTSTKYPKDYKSSINEGYKMRGTWTGNIFYKAHPLSKNQSKVTHHPNIQFNETQLELIKWEEKH
ncbi:MAG: hypothetical protein H6625_10540 [Bdellovibrionaceae bacterium]|nr:hypothetical protein [Pseudobdellovibrionaceae bacterium]